ncbi:hypothetical protein WDW86_07625 [Bdellovibrionota bacterium FG-2]
MFKFQRISIVLGFIFVFCFVSCSAPPYDGGNPNGRAAIIDSANISLSREECTAGIAMLEGLYGSANTGNDVRMLMASAYGCATGINFFEFVATLGSNAGDLAGAGFWKLMTKLFPSTTRDKIMEASLLGTDALLSAVMPGTILMGQSLILNAGGANPGSALATDRIAESNVYLVLMSMATIGSLQSRNGAPDPTTFLKTKSLPWGTATTVDSDGCAYASSIVNFVDALGATSGTVEGSISKTIKTLHDAFATVIYMACSTGCLGTPALWGGVSSGCTAAVDCADCPLALRNRTSCTGEADNLPSCAAAGIVNFINNAPVGWQSL